MGKPADHSAQVAGAPGNHAGHLTLPLIGLLLLAQLSVSSAPILIPMCDLPPATIAAGRLLGAALVFLPFALSRYREELPRIGLRGILQTLVAGALFGLHFVLFIAAFDLTSFESVVVLLSFQPIAALILGRILLKEHSSPAMWFAVTLALAGLVSLVWNDALHDSNLFGGRRVLGDLFVTAACVLIVLSYVAGRRLRQKLSFPVYITLFFASGGVVSLACALILGENPAFHTPEPWFWLLGLIFLPTVLGHALFHFLVKHVRIFYINIVFVLEPLLAVSAKWLIENPERFGPASLGPIQIVGALLLLGGVSIGLIARERRTKD